MSGATRKPIRRTKMILWLLIVTVLLQALIMYRACQAEKIRDALAHVTIPKFGPGGVPTAFPSEGPSPTMMEFGPFVPYPISWPKMVGAIFLFKDDADIGITPEQAKILIPIVERLDNAWERVRQASADLQLNLTLEQQQYIAGKQQSYQLVVAPVSSVIPPGGAGPAPAFRRSYDVPDCIHMLEAASQEPGADKVELATKQVNINMWDMMRGLIELDDDKNPIRAQGKQAASLMKVLVDARDAMERSRLATDDMRSQLTPAQIDFLVHHMPEIVQVKKGVAKQLTALPVPRIKDPLLSVTMGILESKVK